MAWKRRWNKSKKGDGFLVYTYAVSTGAHLLNDYALFKNGSVTLIYNERENADIDEHDLRRRLSGYFRRYGKRIVIVEKQGKAKLFCKAEIHFLYPELPTDEELDTWFSYIKQEFYENTLN